MLDKFIDGLIAELPNTELSARQHTALLAALVRQRGIGDVLETLAEVCGYEIGCDLGEDVRAWRELRRMLLNVLYRWELGQNLERR